MTTVIVPQYLPGEWVAVVTETRVALLPADTPAATLDALWTSLRAADGDGLVHHLHVLTDGLTSLPPFALLTVTGSRLHVVVRGAVTVAVTVAGAARELTAPHVATWSEEVLDGVEEVVVRAPGTGPGPVDGVVALPVVAGTVRAQSVHLRLPTRAVPTATAPAAAPGVPDVAPVVELAPVVEVDEPVEDTLLRPAAAGPAAYDADPAPVVPAPRPARSAAREPVAVHAPAGPAPAPVPAAAPAPVPTPVLTPVPAPVPSSVPTSVPTSVLTPGPAPVIADVLADHDGTTVLSPDVVALREGLPDWAGHALPTPVLAPVAPARLSLSTGETVALDRPVLIGRAPQVSRVTSAQLPRLVTVPSPLQDISRTHAEVRTDGDDVVLTDLRSTNGVLVVRPHTPPQRLQPGEATVLQPGVVVDLGEGVTFTVERGA